MKAPKINPKQEFESFLELKDLNGVQPSKRKIKNFQAHHSAPQKTIKDKLEELKLNGNIPATDFSSTRESAHDEFGQPLPHATDSQKMREINSVIVLYVLDFINILD